MKSRIQTLVMLVVIAVGFSSATAVPTRQSQRGSNAQQSKRLLRLPVAPQLGGTVPPCPTGSTCG